ncbi:MAG: hypothetical protein IJE09_07830 [Oscillospiraceae bacterium]|nr:hypothetical protein [Oscillospiraceae bacterium]
MSNTLAHLAVAYRILEQRPDLVKYRDSFYLGTIAPDSIESKEGAVRDDKKLVHLRLGITDMEWLEPEKMAIFDRRLQDFISYFIYKEKDPRQRDFCIGYLVHLMTDKINHGTVRKRILEALKPQGIEDGKWPFILKVLNELEAMDYYLLNSRPEVSDLFYRLMSQPVKHCLVGLIEKEYLEKSLKWWKEEYIPHISKPRAEIMENHEIDDFVELVAEKIIPVLDEIL